LRRNFRPFAEKGSHACQERWLAALALTTPRSAVRDTELTVITGRDTILVEDPHPASPACVGESANRDVSSIEHLFGRS